MLIMSDVKENLYRTQSKILPLLILYARAQVWFSNVLVWHILLS